MLSATGSRLIRHLLHTPLATRRAFSTSVQEAIRHAVHAGEQTHRGEIRVVVEGDWPLRAVMAGTSLRERALEVFGLTRVWDTEENTGLLIYVLLCEHRVEILADRGLNAAAQAGLWETICAEMTTAFRAGNFEAGCVQAVNRVTKVLAQHFPAEHGNPNELPDLPIVLR